METICEVELQIEWQVLLLWRREMEEGWMEKNLRRQCSSKKLLAKSMAKSLNHNQQSEEPGISQAWACLSIPAALKHGQLTAYAKCRCQAYTVLDFRVH